MTEEQAHELVGQEIPWTPLSESTELTYMVELGYIYHGKITMLNDQETVYETENVNKPLRQAKLWNSHSRYRQLHGWAGDKHHHLIRISYKAQ